MRTNSYKTVRFELDETEKATMDEAWKIMRKVKEKFLTSKMEVHKEQMDNFMKLLNDVVQGKEISEEDAI